MSVRGLCVAGRLASLVCTEPVAVGRMCLYVACV